MNGVVPSMVDRTAARRSVRARVGRVALATSYVALITASITTSGLVSVADAPSTSCTATVIPSRSGRIAVTAAHCVFVGAQRPQRVNPPSAPGWIEDLMFYPGRTGDQVPYGAWPVVRVWIDASYRAVADPAVDVAFIELAAREGSTTQEALGAEGIVFRDPAVSGEVATMLGYPTGAPFDGTLLCRCTTRATTSYIHPDADASLGYDGHMVAMPCAMTAGNSGGPWLVGFDPATGTGTVPAVTSFRSDEDPGLIVAASLGSLAKDLFDAADTSATGAEPGITAAINSAAGTTGEGTTGAARRTASGAAPAIPHRDGGAR